NHGGELGITEGGEAAGNSGHHERKHHCRTCARPAEHQRRVSRPRLNKIQYGCFPNRRLQLLARGRSSSQGENSSSNDRPDTNAGQSEWTENALHLSLRRGGFRDQVIRILSTKKRAHCLDRSACLRKPFPLHRGTPFLIRSTFSLCAPLFGLRLATKKAYARRVHNELCRWRCLQRLRLHCLHLWQTNGLLDADALRSRINAVAALCGRCCFACRQHASGNGGNRLSPYLDRQKNRAAIQRIIRSAEAT